MMSTGLLSRRGALAARAATALAGLALTGLALTGLAGCAPTNPPGVQAGAAAPFPIGQIAVNTAPLAAQSGNLTAQWAQQALPGALAHAFAAEMTPGDPSGATLSVRIDSVYLGNGGESDPDRMRGVATLSGGGAPPRQAQLRATSTYIPMAIDQTLVEQANQGRVQALSQSFAYWLKRKWRL